MIFGSRFYFKREESTTNQEVRIRAKHLFACIFVSKKDHVEENHQRKF